MQHTEEIRGYEGNLTGLTQHIVGLNPTELGEFYSLLGYQFELDSVADRNRGRPNLANQLLQLSRHMKFMGQTIQKAKEEDSDFASSVPKYKNLNHLVGEVANLQYNRLTAFFCYLEDAYFELIASQKEEGLPLLQTSNFMIRNLQLPTTIQTSQELWKICKPYMSKGK